MGNEGAATTGHRETVVTYFRKVGAGDPSVLDLFTEDLRFFCPKFGVARGKAALVRFAEVMAGELGRIEHSIDDFHYIECGDFVVVEGREKGVTRKGVSWPDNVVSEGRFCSVFEFRGALILRMHIYVDPDFTSSDLERVRLFRGAREGIV